MTEISRTSYDFPGQSKKNILYKGRNRLTNQFLGGWRKTDKDNLLSHVNNLANGEPVYLSGLLVIFMRFIAW